MKRIAIVWQSRCRFGFSSLCTSHSILSSLISLRNQTIDHLQILSSTTTSPARLHLHLQRRRLRAPAADQDKRKLLFVSTSKTTESTHRYLQQQSLGSRMAKRQFSWRSLFGGCLTQVEDVPSSLPSPERKIAKQLSKQSSFTRLSYSDVSSHTSAADLSSSLTGSNLCTFTYAELKVATHNFSNSNLLGEGGFGPVYKGFIDEKIKPDVKPQAVAVKLLNLDGFQGHKEWLTEVIMLGQLRDPHLLRLIGYCYEDEHRVLIYEFMCRGSLENHLFKRLCTTLPWKTRIQIAIGAAKGLRFLHEADRPVIYRDFKASNILLDSDYQAKLSDFGLAKDGPQGDDTHVSTRVMGTHGYAAPEYIMTGHLTTKSDVYSFGVVLLELLTGRRAVDKKRTSREQNLVDWAKSSLNDPRRLYRIMDPSMDGQYSTKGAQRAAALAYMCLSHLPKHRPNMKAVVDALEPVLDLDDIPLGTFVYNAVPEEEDGAAKARKEEREAKARRENAKMTRSEDPAATRKMSPRHQQGHKHRPPSPKSASYTDASLCRMSPRHQRRMGATPVH